MLPGSGRVGQRPITMEEHKNKLHRLQKTVDRTVAGIRFY